jgi:hypothetical protein
MKTAELPHFSWSPATSQHTATGIGINPQAINGRASNGQTIDNDAPFGFIFVKAGVDGGGRGIRTPVTLSGKAVFKTACFNHSHIPPWVASAYSPLLYDDFRFRFTRPRRIPP